MPSHRKNAKRGKKMKASQLFDEYINKWRLGRPMGDEEKLDIAIMRVQLLRDEKRRSEANKKAAANNRNLKLYRDTQEFAS